MKKLKLKSSALLLLGIGMFAFVGCEQKSTGEKVKEELTEAKVETSNYLDDKKDALIKQLNNSKVSLDKKLESATEESKEAWEELKIELDDTFDDVRSSTNETIEDTEQKVKKISKKVKNKINNDSH